MNKPNKKLGDCFVKAAELIVMPPHPIPENQRERDEARLVHAICVGKGDIEGKRFTHAWIEWRGFAFDHSNGRPVMALAEDYRRLGRVQWVVEYDRHTAMRMLLDEGTYGPWDEVLLANPD